MQLGDIRRIDLPCLSGMCRALQWLMKSATKLLFGKSNKCSKHLLSSQLDSRHPATVVGHLELNTVRAGLICEADSYRWVLADGAEYLVNGEGAGRGSSSTTVDRHVQRFWASWTVTLPPHSPGCDNLWVWAQRVIRRPAQGPWAGFPGRAGCPDRGSPSRVGYRREAPSVLVDWYRASDPPPVGGMWAPVEDIARFESVDSCLSDGDGFGLTLFDRQTAVRSGWYEKQH